jgi:hypothetical protein
VQQLARVALTIPEFKILKFVPSANDCFIVLRNDRAQVIGKFGKRG